MSRRTSSSPRRTPELVLVQEAQLDELLRLVEAYYAFDGIPFEGPAVRAAALELIANPEWGGAWLIRDGSRFVGHFVVTFGFDFEFGGRQATVTELFLEPEARSHGFGGAVLRFVESFARERGAGAIELQVEDDNLEAQVFYERSGFERRTRTAMSKRLPPR